MLDQTYTEKKLLTKNPRKQLRKIRENPAQNVGLRPGAVGGPGAGAGGQCSLDHQGPRAANGKRSFDGISNVFLGFPGFRIELSI